jgi:16S rRNA (adenine1518-N6/adenine1519-N6)-dimethyltransferase
VVRLGQNFLADPNLLAAIVREAEVDPDDVVLEVGGGEGVLTTGLAAVVRHVHVIELDRGLEPALRSVAAERGNVELHFADAMRFDLATLEPAPTAMVANLPYSIATPLLLRTTAELPSLRRWTVMVQREIADRLRAAPGSRTYGAPSVLVQLAAGVEMLRSVDRAVFSPRPRVDSALLRLTRRGPAPPAEVRELVRGAFAHRRKSMPRSLELAGGYERDAVRGALADAGLASDARAEALAPDDFVRVAGLLGAASS